MALVIEVSKRIVPGTQSNASMVIFLDWMSRIGVEEASAPLEKPV
jgi:hypothetical protein